MTIWIRVYRLPLRAMNKDMGLRLGNSVGTAMGVDHHIEGGNMGEFLRILVQVDIRKPLRRCVLLGAALGKPATPCPLRYERLPEFCYYCGLVGHGLAACPSKPADLDNKQLQYGSWLRVQTQQPRPGPRRRTGIEYFSDPATGSTETSPTNVPTTDTQAPAVAPASSSTGTDTVETASGGAVKATVAEASVGQDTPVGLDTAQGPHGTKTTTDATTVAAAALVEDGPMHTATVNFAPSRIEPADNLGAVEGVVSSQVQEFSPLHRRQLMELWLPHVVFLTFASLSGPILLFLQSPLRTMQLPGRLLDQAAAQ
ncbi:hypothetical protein V6N11_035741 [Hibiscus sabdariffa]|uniref:Zinc knuckle CX2CX4HX4C domain-containing protein n=1 Tax=Hibiscus sabdariffa TaxID=183260 RepID=A0ABR2R8B6_9ROSI